MKFLKYQFIISLTVICTQLIQCTIKAPEDKNGKSKKSEANNQQTISKNKYLNRRVSYPVSILTKKPIKKEYISKTLIIKGKPQKKSSLLDFNFNMSFFSNIKKRFLDWINDKEEEKILKKDVQKILIPKEEILLEEKEDIPSFTLPILPPPEIILTREKFIYPKELIKKLLSLKKSHTNKNLLPWDIVYEIISFLPYTINLGYLQKDNTRYLDLLLKNAQGSILGKGLNLEGICHNSKCKLYKKYVWCLIDIAYLNIEKFGIMEGKILNKDKKLSKGSKYYMKMGNLIPCCYCSVCEQKVNKHTIERIGLYNCCYDIEVTKKGNKFLKIRENKTSKKDEFLYFKIKKEWETLHMVTRPLNYLELERKEEEKKRLKKERKKSQRERILREKEKSDKRAEESDRHAKEERIAKEKFKRENEELERKAKEERLAKEKLKRKNEELERKAKEERIAKENFKREKKEERIAKEQFKRKNEELERKAKEERLAREQFKRKNEELERIAKEEITAKESIIKEKKISDKKVEDLERRFEELKKITEQERLKEDELLKKSDLKLLCLLNTIELMKIAQNRNE